jgi:hypothetical protein
MRQPVRAVIAGRPAVQRSTGRWDERDRSVRCVARATCACALCAHALRARRLAHDLVGRRGGAATCAARGRARRRRVPSCHPHLPPCWYHSHCACCMHAPATANTAAAIARAPPPPTPAGCCCGGGTHPEAWAVRSARCSPPGSIARIAVAGLRVMGPRTTMPAAARAQEPRQDTAIVNHNLAVAVTGACNGRHPVQLRLCVTCSHLPTGIAAAGPAGPRAGTCEQQGGGGRRTQQHTCGEGAGDAAAHATFKRPHADRTCTWPELTPLQQGCGQRRRCVARAPGGGEGVGRAGSLGAAVSG